MIKRILVLLLLLALLRRYLRLADSSETTARAALTTEVTALLLRLNRPAV